MIALFILLLVISFLQMGYILNSKKMKWYIFLYCFSETLCFTVLWLLSNVMKISTIGFYITLIIVVIIKLLIKIAYKKQNKLKKDI